MLRGPWGQSLYEGEMNLHIIATLYGNIPEGLVNASPGELASPEG